jgi:MFS transporter, SP family, arabinose:H+ symporter
MKNKKLILWSLTVSLAGLLFGLDTAVISGAEKTIQNLWQLDSLTHGMAVAMALFGTVFGSLFGGIPTENIGRKNTLLWIGILFLVSSLGSAIAPNVYVFMIFRFIGGLSIGAASVTTPIYISEIAPAKNRGLLVALFQFNIVFGIMLAYISNYLLEGTNADDWRWMLGIVAIPSLIFTLLVLLIPESPRWLILKKGEDAKALEVLQQIDPESADATFQKIKNTKNENKNKLGFGVLFNDKYKKATYLAITLAFFNQLSGINAIIYYAPRIFEVTGEAKTSALFSTAGIGVVNPIFTIVGVSLIDKFGRKTLMLIGSIGYIVSLALITNSFHTSSFDNVVYYIFMFIASHAIGQGAVIWVFIAEIFPNEVRYLGQSIGTFTHWILAAIIALIFPKLTESIGATTTFSIFCVMMIFQLIFVLKIMPETKGTSLEEMDTMILKH